MALAADHLGGYGKAEQFVNYTEQRAHLLIGRGGNASASTHFRTARFRNIWRRHLANRVAGDIAARALAEESDAWRETLNLAVGTLTFNQRFPTKRWTA